MIKTDDNNYHASNILIEKELKEVIENLKRKGKTIGLCAGSFDLLHPGHMTHLNSAKKICDVLVVGIARDLYNSQKNDKKGRPVFSEKVRAFWVSQMKSVDFVVINEDTQAIINLISPQMLIVGPDYKNNINPRMAAEKKLLESKGGKLVFTRNELLSTTAIINYIKNEIK